ncbi:MAG: hypothetical protein ABJZ55_03125 [Fuerstiella sp.]
MKSSPDFQTGSILLLAATLICIGLAIAVIAPIIDSPLSASTEADTIAANQMATQPSSEGHPLVEFFPPIVRASHELNRSQKMTGTTNSLTIKEQTLASAENVTTIPPQPVTNEPLKTVEVAASNTPQTPTIPAYFPQGGVYAPITIHQPAANQVSTGREISDVAERIERLVTERERLAAAVEMEKRRQTETARRTRRKQAAEFQQNQIARLEQELKLLNQSMTSLQQKTSTHLSRLEEQNSQIDVASQALRAYREAFTTIKSESAKTADQQQLRTAQAPSNSSQSLKRQDQNSDDAGRVQIPILPSIPTHKHSLPAPLQPVEQPPQTAEARQKRFRVSAPVRTFKPLNPEVTQSFLPLPTASGNSTPKATKPSIKATKTASPAPAQQQMQLIPLDAPTIREFPIENAVRPKQPSDQKKNVKRQQKEAKVLRPIKTDAIPDLNVAFEHTYQFESTPIIQDAAEADLTEIIVTTIDLEVPQHVAQQQARTVEQPVTLQFEPIDFPDLSIKNDSDLSVSNSRRTAHVSKPNVVPNTYAPQKFKPLVAAGKPPRPQHDADVKSAIQPEPSGQKSWIQKVSGAFNPLQKTKSGSSAEPAQSTSRPHLGGRGQNRHVLRSRTGKKRLKLSIPSSTDDITQTPSPKEKTPNMLQRIGNTLQRVGGTQN